MKRFLQAQTIQVQAVGPLLYQSTQVAMCGWCGFCRWTQHNGNGPVTTALAGGQHVLLTAWCMLQVSCRAHPGAVLRAPVCIHPNLQVIMMVQLKQ